jgi:hypothetical protein
VDVLVTRDERAAMVALLEAEYASPEEAAESVFAGAAEILMRRDSWGLGLDGIAWGPFYSLREVKKVAAVIGARIAKLYAPAVLVGKALGTFEDVRYCPECQHPRLAHMDRSWKWKGERWARQPGCCATNCECKQTFSQPRKRAA